MKVSKKLGTSFAILAVVAAATCFSWIYHRDHSLASLPILPGAKKTRLVFLQMTPEDWRRDEAYGSVYPSIKQAQNALAINPQDSKAHRTLARGLVNQMYTDKDYLSTPSGTPKFQEVESHLLMPVAAEYRAALQADPENPVTKSNLAATYFQMGKQREAIVLYKQVESYPPLEETAEIALRRLQSKPASTQAVP